MHEIQVVNEAGYNCTFTLDYLDFTMEIADFDNVAGVVGVPKCTHAIWSVLGAVFVETLISKQGKTISTVTNIHLAGF